MLIYLIVLIFFVISILLYFVFVYNGLILLSNNIEKAWANIDVLLKQRYDELPKLLKVCEGYMKYEGETLQKITNARSACLNAKTVGETSVAESALSQSLKTLFAVSENYPELKANESFGQLQERVSYLESQLADRREFYNDSVNLYNIRISSIPDMFIAGTLQMKKKEMFEVQEAERKDVEIKFDFK